MIDPSTEAQAVDSAQADTGPKATAASKVDPKVFTDELRGAIIFRNRGGRIKRWKTYTQIISNNYNGSVKKDSPVVNIIASRVRSIAPQVAFNDPTFRVDCIGALPNPNSEAAASVMLGKIWRDEEVGSVTQRVLMDWPGLGRGVWFVGFEASNEGDVLDSKRSVADAQVEVEKQSKARVLIEKMRKTFSGTADKPIDPSREARTFSLLLSMRVFAERVSNFNFVLDPCADSPQNATYMARQIFLPYSRAQLMFGADCPTANSIGNVAVYTNESETDPFSSTEKGDAALFPDQIKRVAVWELWDIVLRKTVYISSETGLVIGEPFEWKSAHPGFPFVLVDWDETSDNVYPEGIASAIHSLNNEMNTIRKRELQEAKKAVNVRRVNKSAHASVMAALENAEDDALIPMEDEDTLENITNGQIIPPDFWTLENRILANMDEVSRTSSQDSGSMNAVNRSATEVSIANSGSQATISLRQLQVENAAAQIAERMLAAIFVTFDEPIMLRIINRDPDYVDPATGMLASVGSEIDYEFIGVDHAAFYKVSVSSGSMASVAQDVERQQAGEVFQLYGNEPWFDRKAFALHHMSMFTSIKNPSQFVLKQDSGNPLPTNGNELPTNGGQEATNGRMLPSVGGTGSGNMQADILASTYGAGAPMTGTNGYPGPVQ